MENVVDSLIPFNMLRDRTRKCDVIDVIKKIDRKIENVCKCMNMLTLS